MLKRSSSYLVALLICRFLAMTSGSSWSCANAEGCPTNTDPIATDRPDVTNSSLVVPTGSLQAENGIDWTVRDGSDALQGTNTRLRLGIAHCTEFVLDVPSYVEAFNGKEASGFSNLVVSFKRQLPVPLGFDLSATAGLGFPSGQPKLEGRGYQSYIQFPWSHPIVENWEMVGMFTVTWFPNDSVRNPTFEPTLSVEREFGPRGDVFIEYVADYDHQRPSHLLDGGGAWRFTKTQQLDFHAGFGLNSSTVDHYFGIGYSFRLDDLFGNAGNQP
jgi:hypothetical protein